MEWLMAAGAAAALTLFDLDRTFDVPDRDPTGGFRRRVSLAFQRYFWSGGFVIVNAGLAALLYVSVGNHEGLQGIANPWFRALLVGCSYLALIQTKFTTLNFNGSPVPFGLELFYSGMKEYAYKRIERVAIVDLLPDLDALVDRQDLQELAKRARRRVNWSRLPSPVENDRRKAWIRLMVTDIETSEIERCEALAAYIRRGERAGPV